MTYTEKILAEFNEKFVVHCSDGDILGKDGKNEVIRARLFLSTSIQQARAEERARVVGEIKKLATCGDCNGTGIKDCDKCERDSHKCSRCLQSGEIDIHKDDLLSSLDKPNKDI